MNARKTDSNRGNSRSQSKWRVSMRRPTKIGRNKNLNWLVKQKPNPGGIEEFCSYVFNSRNTQCDFKPSWQKTFRFIAMQKFEGRIRNWKFSQFTQVSIVWRTGKLLIILEDLSVRQTFRASRSFYIKKPTKKGNRWFKNVLNFVQGT